MCFPEASKVDGLPIRSAGLAFARFLQTYEQLLGTRFESEFDRAESDRRLIEINKRYKSGDIYGRSMNLRALIMAHEPSDFGDFKRTKSILLEIVNSKKNSIRAEKNCLV